MLIIPVKKVWAKVKVRVRVTNMASKVLALK